MTEDMIREAMAQTVPSHLRPRKWMPRTNGAQHRRIDHDRVVALRAEGLTYRQIADRVFCEIATVENIMRTHRLNGGAA